MKKLVLNVCPNCAMSCQAYPSHTEPTSIAPLIGIQRGSVHDALRQKDPLLLNVCYDCGVSLQLDPPQSSPLPPCWPELTEVSSEAPALVNMKMKQALLIQMRHQLKTSHATIKKLTQKVRRIKRLCGVSLKPDPPQSSPLPLAGPHLTMLEATSTGTAAFTDLHINIKTELVVEMSQQLKTSHATIIQLSQKVRRMKRLFEQQEVPRTNRHF
jgi:hypothetical protein